MICDKKPTKELVVDLTGSDGNAFALLGYTSLKGSCWSNGSSNKAYLAIFEFNLGKKWNIINKSKSYESWMSKKDFPKNKNIIFNESQNTKVRVIQSLEELNYFEDFDTLRNLYYKLKTLKMKYRVPLEEVVPKSVCSKKHIKSRIILYNF